MANIVSVISSFLLILQTNSGILARIEFMVILNSILLLVLFIFDTYRRRSRSQLLKYILLAVDAASFSMVLHTIGLMQSAQISNSLFEVWAILLVALRFSINYITVYGLEEQVRVQWNVEFGAALASYAWVGRLNGTRGLYFKKPLWALWALQPLRIGYMYLAYMLARTSYWQGRSSVLVADYMKAENESKDRRTSSKKNESSEPKANNPDACLEVGPSRDSKVSHQSNKSPHTVEDSEPETVQMITDEGKVKLRTNSQISETEIVEVTDRNVYEEPSNGNRNTEPPQHIEEANVRTNVGDPSNSGAYDPSSMAGYRYLIQGETWQEVEHWGFEDVLQLRITNKMKLITLDKIWECKGLLGEWGDKDGQLKDLCLSFAMYRLLRCRFDDYPLPDISVCKTRMLLVDGILSRTTKDESVEQRNKGNKDTGDVDVDSREGKEGTEEQKGGVIPKSREHEKQTSGNDNDGVSEELDRDEKQPNKRTNSQNGRTGKRGRETMQLDAADEDKLNGKVADRVFEITGAELSFLNDYMYSRFPIVFWTGGGIIISIFIYAITLATTVWVGISVVRVYTPPDGDFTHVIHGYNIDLFITWGMLFFIVFKETWEILIYLLSDWTKVVLISTYVECTCMKNWLFENLIWLLCKCSMVGQWHGKIDQYNFLAAYNYRPPACNLAYYSTLGSLPKGADGVQTKSPIVLPNEVKKAIVRSIYSLKKEINTSRLPGRLPFILHRNNLSERISQMFKLHELPTCSQIILVWHIATSLCEVELCRQYNVYLADSDFPSIWSSVWSFLSCCSSEPFLVKQERLGKDLRKNFIAANSLSQYCAHLLIKQPDLLPDHIFIPEEVFQHTVCDAQKVLEGCDSLQTIYKRLMKEGEKEIKSEKEKTIMRLSAKLGYLLIETLDEEARWKALAGVWADLLVHMAPNSNVKAHADCLATGGEFITHVWILLYHAGILENNLLDQEVKSDIP